MEIRIIRAFFQKTPWSTGVHPSPCLRRRVEWISPIPEKKQMAAPARKGMNPVPGDAGVPSLYCREPRHTANPRMNQTVLLSWSLFNASLLFDSQLGDQFTPFFAELLNVFAQAFGAAIDDRHIVRFHGF